MEEQDDKLVAEAVGSPFCREIREAPVPEGFKLLTIKAYEGKAEPQGHHFNDLMERHIVSELTKHRVFVVTLTNGVKKWFRSMTPGSVTIW